MTWIKGKNPKVRGKILLEIGFFVFFIRQNGVIINVKMILENLLLVPTMNNFTINVTMSIAKKFETYTIVKFHLISKTCLRLTLLSIGPLITTTYSLRFFLSGTRNTATLAGVYEFNHCISCCTIYTKCTNSSKNATRCVSITILRH